jgi:ABC-2 type transport system permease protein
LSSQLIRIYAFAYRNYIFAVRNFFTFAEMLFWPVIGILSIGLMTGFLSLGGNMKSFLLTGAILAGVFQTSQLDVAYGFLYDVWSKSVKQTFIAPVKNVDYIAGSWIIGTVRGIITFFMLAVIAIIFFKFTLPNAAVLWIALSGVYLMAMITGMMTIFFIFMFGQRIDIIAWMMSALTMLLCGIYYPVTYLPAVFSKIAQVIPLTYFLEYFRTGYGFSLNFTHPVLKGYGLSAIYIGILYWMIEMAFLRAKKTGMLIRLSE